MGEVLELFREGRVTLRKPPGVGALELAAGCDWGHCGRPGYGWRWAGPHGWLVVCRRCAHKPVQGENPPR